MEFVKRVGAVIEKIFDDPAQYFRFRLKSRVFLQAGNRNTCDFSREITRSSCRFSHFNKFLFIFPSRQMKVELYNLLKDPVQCLKTDL